MSKRKAAAPPTVINVTINNYFAPKPAPAPAPDASTGLKNLFPNDERRRYKSVPYHGKTRSVLVSCAKPDGTLLGGCFNCTKSFLPIERFAPTECNNNGRNRPDFFTAVNDYAAAYAARDLVAAKEARERVEEKRIGLCPPCVVIAAKLTPAQQACKDEWIRMRKAACAAQDGCCKPNCVERGPQAWCVLEADHVHTKAEEDEALRKEEKLSHYKYWAGNGGVPAMHREAAKGLNWPCRFCHRLEPTDNASKKCPDPVTMPDGKRNGTKEERAQYKRKRSATVRYPKQQLVDARKRAIGSCALCARPVLVKQEHAWIFDHLDPATKMKGNDTLAGEKGGVAGLVGNHAKAAALGKIRDILVREMGLCRLLCANCDRRQTDGYPLRV